MHWLQAGPVAGRAADLGGKLILISWKLWVAQGVIFSKCIVEKWMSDQGDAEVFLRKERSCQAFAAEAATNDDRIVWLKMAEARSRRAADSEKKQRRGVKGARV